MGISLNWWKQTTAEWESNRDEHCKEHGYGESYQSWRDHTFEDNTWKW